ncbi:hypothetical protein [Streptomyces sp. NPDC054784]
MPVETTLPLATETMTDDVEALLNPTEADGTFRDSAECAVLLLAGGKVLLAPPTPRPKG